MAKFLKGNQLNAAIENIFEKANSEIFIISPYIKLHSRIKDVLSPIKRKPDIALILVFGKNDQDLFKSLSQEDFNYLKEFPNVEIRHESRLHAKYYANEKQAILSSMNLYEFSHNNNIEFGILTQKASLLDKLTIANDNLDEEAFTYFEEVIENSQLLYKTTPIFKEKTFSSEYINSDKVVDKLSNTFSGSSNYQVLKSDNGKQQGFCIRTGVSIPFNIEKPMSYEAFKSWSKFSNPEYPEKFCHFSGEPSNGETSVSRPILKKNWKKAKEVFAFV